MAIKKEENEQNNSKDKHTVEKCIESWFHVESLKFLIDNNIKPSTNTEINCQKKFMHDTLQIFLSHKNIHWS